jgi:hypothetical protein
MFDGDDELNKKKKKSKSRKRLANSAKISSGIPREKDNEETEDN